MKKPLVFGLMGLVVVVLIVVVSMDKNDTPVDTINELEISKVKEEELNLLEGISLEKVGYDNRGIIFTLKNKRDDTIYFGDEVILEKKQDDKWYVVPYSGEIGFTNLLLFLSPTEESEQIMELDIWIPITDGDYRIIKEVSLEEGVKNLHYISAEFTITK